MHILLQEAVDLSFIPSSEMSIGISLANLG